jgi:transcriptional regulator with XRE-family HTH domain
MKISDIAGSIRTAREAKRMRLTELARQARVSRATLDALENGRKSDIGVKTLERIANVLGLEVRLFPRGIHRPTLSELIAEDNEDEH